MFYNNNNSPFDNFLIYYLDQTHKFKYKKKTQKQTHFSGFTISKKNLFAGGLFFSYNSENIVVGAWPHDCDKIYLLDFGLSKAFITSVDGVLELDERADGELFVCQHFSRMLLGEYVNYFYITKILTQCLYLLLYVAVF